MEFTIDQSQGLAFSSVFAFPGALLDIDPEQSVLY
jgi:hypothetical protein